MKYILISALFVLGACNYANAGVIVSDVSKEVIMKKHIKSKFVQIEQYQATRQVIH